jgi:23S rRNA (adenine2503-C2)-methyltransferase
MSETTAKTNLLGLTRAELEAFVANMGEKPFRARQLMKWLYKRQQKEEKRKKRIREIVKKEKVKE